MATKIVKIEVMFLGTDINEGVTIERPIVRGCACFNGGLYEVKGEKPNFYILAPKPYVPPPSPLPRPSAALIAALTLANMRQ